MANIVCVWEHGAALGHLANLKPFLERAVKDGHDVTLVSREMPNIPTVLGDLPIRILPVPMVIQPKRDNISWIQSIGMLLANFYRIPGSLPMLYRVWGDIFDLLKPDLVIYDHAPSALIASLSRSWRKWIVGSGFLVPRTDEQPFGVFPAGQIREDTELRKIEQADTALLEMINGCLGQGGVPNIGKLSDLWDQADRKWLLTIPELDHFGVRQDTEYLGVPAGNAGTVKSWPDRPGEKIMGYVSECAALEPMLTLLDRQKNINAIFYSRDIDAERAKQFPNITFSEDPLNLAALLPETRLMIHMGSHKTALETWLAGVPQLMLARHQEQLILARRISSQRRGVAASAASKDVAKPLQAAFALANAGLLPSDPNHAQDMLGGRLQREIDIEFRKLRGEVL